MTILLWSLAYHVVGFVVAVVNKRYGPDEGVPAFVVAALWPVVGLFYVPGWFDRAVDWCARRLP